jgi:hypothetical protein
VKRSARLVVRSLGLFACCLLTACGRLGFDEAADADGGSPDGAAAEECGPHEIICGNFEGGLGQWVPRGDNGLLTRVGVIDDPVALGQGSLQIETNIDGQSIVGAQRTFPPIREGSLYARTMMWVGEETSISDFLVAIQLDDGDDTGQDKVSVDILPYGGFVLTATTVTPAVRPGSAPNVVDRKHWMCMRLEIDLDEQSGSVRLYEHDNLLIAINGIDTIPSPDGFTRMMLAAVQPNPAIGRMVFDAAALSQAPLECPF